ncbi:MAG: hypothetical protein IPI19_18895 [Ignavibacteriales bacterium]|nr:hypothetical protein [Ignavibacteriales bacterium]
MSTQPVQMAGLSNIYNGDKTFVNGNENSLPRAYFVNKVEMRDNLEVINLIKANGLILKE